jgi:hypothetical protein
MSWLARLAYQMDEEPVEQLCENISKYKEINMG